MQHESHASTCGHHFQTFQQRKQNLLHDIVKIGKQGGLYAFLVNHGAQSPPFPAEVDRKNCLLPGCLFNVWLFTRQEEGLLQVYTDSDSKITKGTISLLARLLGGLTRDEIIRADLDFLYRDVLRDTLKSMRMNSIRNVEDRIKMAALHMRRRAG